MVKRMPLEYSDEVMDYFKNPKNSGKIENPDITAKAGSIACGDMLKLYMNVNDQEIIEEMKFESFGCAANIATSSKMTEIAKGKTIEEAKQITFKDIIDALEGLPNIKYHCSNLSIEALNLALSKYEILQNKKEINKEFAKQVLKAVLDPRTGKDIITENKLKNLEVKNEKITIEVKEEDEPELIKEQIKEAFEGLKIKLNIKFT